MTDIDTAIIQPLPGIGDMIWHIPALRAIAADLPGGRFVLCTRPSVQADRLFAAEPMVAGVVPVHSGRGTLNSVVNMVRLIAALRRPGYRRVFILHNSARYGLAATLAGIPERLGYGVGGRSRWLTRPVALPANMERGCALDKSRFFVTAAGLPLGDPVPTLTVAPAARAAVLARFGALPRPWIVLGIGASVPEKTWPAARFGALADRLAAAGAGTLFLLGSPKERDDAARTAAAVTSAHAVPVTDLAIDPVLALLAESRLFVGNDSGPMNMAAAVGRPAFGLFGATVPLDYSPWLHPVVTPGGWREPGGMERITVDQVMATLAPSLERIPV